MISKVTNKIIEHRLCKEVFSADEHNTFKLKAPLVTNPLFHLNPYRQHFIY